MDSLAQVSPPTSPGRGDYFHSNGGFRSKKQRGDRPRSHKRQSADRFRTQDDAHFRAKMSAQMYSSLKV